MHSWPHRLADADLAAADALFAQEGLTETVLPPDLPAHGAASKPSDATSNAFWTEPSGASSPIGAEAQLHDVALQPSARFTHVLDEFSASSAPSSAGPTTAPRAAASPHASAAPAKCSESSQDALAESAPAASSARAPAEAAAAAAQQTYRDALEKAHAQLAAYEAEYAARKPASGDAEAAPFRSTDPAAVWGAVARSYASILKRLNSSTRTSSARHHEFKALFEERAAHLAQSRPM